MSLRIVLVVVAAVIAAASTAPGPATAADRSKCYPRGSQTLAVNEVVRIYRTRIRHAGGGHWSAAYGCVLRRGKPRALESYGAPDGMFRLRLSGRYLAYASSFHCTKSHGDCGGWVKVVDVATGRRVASGPFYATDTPESPAEPYVMHDLALDRRGRAAFIISGQDGMVETWFIAPGGTRRRLDRAPDVEPGSLALAATRAYWTRGGLPQTARLH